MKQELIRQDEQANRIYYEPRCHEGNFGLPTMLLGARAEERFAEAFLIENRENGSEDYKIHQSAIAWH